MPAAGPDRRDPAREGAVGAVLLAGLLLAAAAPPMAPPVDDCPRPARVSGRREQIRCEGGGGPPEGAVRLLYGLRLDAARAAVSDLEALPGIGPARAAALARARERAPLCGPADLLRVPGIGPVTVRRLAPRLRFTDPRCVRGPGEGR